jgi:hypothetical protein
MQLTTVSSPGCPGAARPDIPPERRSTRRQPVRSHHRLALAPASHGWGDVVSKEGDARPDIERPLAHFRFISPHYFGVMGIALRRGKIPAEGDRSRQVAVISESVAQKVWPGEDAVGKRIRKNDDPKTAWVEVIGVVGDVRTVSLEKQPPLIVYVPYWDGPYWQGQVWGDTTYLVRTAQDPSAMTGAFRRAVRNQDSELPLAKVSTMQEVVSESVGRRRFQTLLAAVFAVSALLLACLGIYGVISYGVARRTNEMGIRMALGAQPSRVALTVLRQDMTPVFGGLILGVLGSLWAGQLLSTLV